MPEIRRRNFWYWTHDLETDIHYVWCPECVHKFTKTYPYFFQEEFKYSPISFEVTRHCHSCGRIEKPIKEV